MSEDLNQIYCRKSVDMKFREISDCWACFRYSLYLVFVVSLLQEWRRNPDFQLYQLSLLQVCYSLRAWALQRLEVCVLCYVSLFPLHPFYLFMCEHQNLYYRSQSGAFQKAINDLSKFHAFTTLNGLLPPLLVILFSASSSFKIILRCEAGNCVKFSCKPTS